MERSGNFSDLAEGGDAYWCVRSASIGIGLALSLKSDSDIEVWLNKETALQIAHALLDAAGETG